MSVPACPPSSCIHDRQLSLCQSIHLGRRTAHHSQQPTNALAITDEASPLVLLSTQFFRGEQCAGARPHAGRCPAAVQWRRRSERGADAVTVLGGRALPSAVTQARSCRPAGGCRWRGMSGRRPCRSLLCCPPRPVRREDVRPAGRADIQCPGVRCPGVRCIGCPDGQAPVSARCRAVRTALGPRAARCGGRPPLGWARAGRRAAVVRERRGRLLASGRTGSNGTTLAMAGSHQGRP